MTSRLLSIGSIVVDQIYRIDALPAPGDDVTASSYDVLPGGGFNALVASIRAGLPAAFAGQLGSGPNSDLLRIALAGEGIAVLTRPNPTRDSGVSTVLVTADADRSFVSWPGAEAMAFDPNDVDALPQDWILATGYALSYPESGPSLAALVERLSEHNVVVFDPTPVVTQIDSKLLRRVLAATRWLSCNEAEARFIAGASSDIAAGLLERHCPKADGVVIRRGAQGCLARLRNGQERAIPGYEVEAVDTNGAGDTHIGAFIAALSRGDNPFAAARYANAAAAIAVTRRGGPTGPTHAEIEEFLAARNARPERRAG